MAGSPVTADTIASFDLARETVRELNARLHAPDSAGGRVLVSNPGGKHAIAVGLDALYEVEIAGHVGYYCAGMNKQATVRISGNCGVGVAENMMSGAVVVRATFPNPNNVLLPGLYVRARLIEGVREKGLLAPQAGVTRNERGQATALVLGPGDVVAQRIVRTDQAIGDKWGVTDGRTAGDKLIVDGLLNLQPGAKVRARLAAAGS